MATYKIVSINSTTFTVNGRAFNKGQYELEYNASGSVFLRPNAFPVGNSPVPQRPPWKTPQPYTNFLDVSDAPYASLLDLSTALSAMVANPTNASTSDIISDKASVTQITSKTTTVVSNTLSTIITTFALSDAADAAFSFTFTNSKIAATSIVLPSVNMNSGTGKANITVTPASGSATVTVTNVGTASFNSAIKIGLVVI